MFIHIFVDIKGLFRNSPRPIYFMESIIYYIFIWVCRSIGMN